MHGRWYTQSENEEGKADDEKDDGDGDSDAMSVDRAFVKRITWG